MKIQIDTHARTIKVLENTNLAEFVKAAKKILGNQYSEYTLEYNATIYTWTSPWIIYTTPYYPWPHLQVYDDTGGYHVTDGEIYQNSNTGIYNFEIKSSAGIT